ncbi:MAG: hypothetical protein JXR83_13600, partial [Deltaproteobacteria bacterium]|nr:hypothetical protein [Deltaproteobacteria bacterium]
MRKQSTLIASSSLALALAACQFDVASTPPPEPELTRVAPDRGYNGEAVPVVIEGRNLKPLITQDVSQPGGVAVDTTFVARLGSTELAQVTYVNDERLTAMVPAGIPAGAHALEVETPAGDKATLADAYTATATPEPVLTGVTPTDVVNDQAETLIVTGQRLSDGMT